MRVMIVNEDTDLARIGEQLLRAKTGVEQSRAALEALQAANPHVSAKKIRAGTVLLVPDAASFKVSLSEPLGGEALGELQQLVRNGLDAAATKLGDGNASRASARADVAAALRSAAVKRLAGDDAELAQQIDAAIKGFKADEQSERDAEQAFATLSRDALAAIKSLAA
jgi:hypothetical protein